jgi:molybdate transport system substrate-binding protein
LLAAVDPPSDSAPKARHHRPINGKSVVAQGRPVGAAIESGEAEIGVQQVAELRPVPGVDQFAELPTGRLAETDPLFRRPFSQSKRPSTARALVSFLRSAQAQDVLKRKGMDLIMDGPPPLRS